MRDPERFADNPSSDVEARLLQVGRAYRASPDARARALAAVGALGASTSLAGAAAAQLGGKLGLVAAASVAAGVAVTGFVWTSSSTEAARPAAAPAPRVERAAPAPAPAPAAPATTVPAPEEAATSAPAGRQDVAPSAAAKPARPTRAARAPSSLQEELARLDAASSLLRGGSAAAALAELDRYDRDFGAGKLRMESAVLRVEALARAGQAQRARTLADAFLKRHSASVLAPRVRRYATPP